MTMTGDPRVTVLMPLHNGEPYLADALASILEQTFTDFELLVIDDGSTDGSAALVRACADGRIRLVHNGANLGVTASLNRGIQLARGTYVARMDSDDISLPDRLARQVAFLDEHPDCAMVAATVTLMDRHGVDCGVWDDDGRTTTAAEIRRFLPRANCIAHPGVMIRRSVLAAYSYDERQRVAQDYDLWLRLAADGLTVAKLAEPLLRYRLNPASVTARSRGRIPDLKNVRTKAHFLRGRLRAGRLNGFCLRVAAALGRDLCYALGNGLASLYRPESPLCGVPVPAGAAGVARDLRVMACNGTPLVRFLVAVGQGLGHLLPLGNRSGLFFFFPFFHVGGAEKVHAQVVSCCAEKRPWVIFTKRSENRAFRGLFPRGARLLNLWPFLKYGYPFSIGVVSGFINRHPSPVVFGSNSLFFYLLLPYLAERVRCLDLLHAMGGGAELFSLPVARRLATRVVVNGQTRDELTDLYRRQGCADLADRLRLIENMVAIPQVCPEKDTGSLQVLYVGRGSSEKRLHLIARAARICHQEGVPVTFTLVGALGDALSAADREVCRCPGEIVDSSALACHYAAAHVLVLTSSREGFPLVVMEAMAQGVVPVCTRVGGIDRHVRHGDTGLLLENGPEEAIVQELVAALRSLCADRALLETLSRQACDHARAAFGPERFRAAYGALLEGPCPA